MFNLLEAYIPSLLKVTTEVEAEILKYSSEYSRKKQEQLTNEYTKAKREYEEWKKQVENKND